MKNLTAIIICMILGTASFAQVDSATILLDSITPAPARKHVIAKAAAGMAYGGAIFLVYKNADTRIQQSSQSWKTDIKEDLSSSIASLGTAETNWIGWGLTSGFAFATGNTKLQHTIVVWAGSLGINEITTNTIKNSFQRYRPVTGKSYNEFDGADGPKENRSFPSYHTSTAFTTATVFATMYKDKKWVAPLAYGTATLVGLSRINDNAHWASDVMAGAAVGFLSAKAMIELDKLLYKHRIRIYPQVSKQHAVVGMLYAF